MMSAPQAHWHAGTLARRRKNEADTCSRPEIGGAAICSELGVGFCFWPPAASTNRHPISACVSRG